MQKVYLFILFMWKNQYHILNFFALINPPLVRIKIKPKEPFFFLQNNPT